jgi:hypothetical protein
MADLGLISAAMAKSTICRGEKISNGGESQSSDVDAFISKFIPCGIQGILLLQLAFTTLGLT